MCDTCTRIQISHVQSWCLNPQPPLAEVQMLLNISSPINHLLLLSAGASHPCELCVPNKQGTGISPSPWHSLPGAQAALSPHRCVPRECPGCAQAVPRLQAAVLGCTKQQLPDACRNASLAESLQGEC